MTEQTAAERSADDTSRDDQQARKLTGRSPAYPFFDLERSLDRVRQLYEKEKMHAAPVMTALGHWGYTNASGKAGMTLSALKQFGLLEDIGRGDSRRVQLTTRAHDILNTPHPDERSQLLREAALNPGIHREMWEKYGKSLPSDDSLAWTLTKDRNFTSSGAADFIRQWKRTMDFAALADMSEQASEGAASASEGETDLVHEETDRISAGTSAPVDRLGASLSGSPHAAALQSYPIPIALTGRAPVTVSGPFPLSEAEWTQFIAVLSAMKPVLAGSQAVTEASHPPESGAFEAD